MAGPRAAGRAAPEVRVVLERGRTWTFAGAVDWPGWCRRGKGEEGALDALLEYAPRYRAVVGDLATARPGDDLADPRLHVVETLPGSATTDFGAPGARFAADGASADDAESTRLIAALDRCWDYFDAVAAAAPEQLHKGPRGGGRNTGAIVDHVREAERSYSRKVGVRIPPRTPWPDQRRAVREALRTVLPAAASPSAAGWPPRYIVRRTAWHVLDHAWEIEDKTPTP